MSHALVAGIVMITGAGPGVSKPKEAAPIRPETPKRSIEVRTDKPVVRTGETYLVLFRYENRSDAPQEVFVPPQSFVGKLPFKLMLFDHEQRYVGDLLREPIVSGSCRPLTCAEWVRVPAGGTFERGFRCRGAYLPERFLLNPETALPSGRYFLQLSFDGLFFTECPFREELHRLNSLPDAEGRSEKIRQMLLERTTEWATRPYKADVVRSDKVDIIFAPSQGDAGLTIAGR